MGCISLNLAVFAACRVDPHQRSVDPAVPTALCGRPEHPIAHLRRTLKQLHTIAWGPTDTTSVRMSLGRCVRRCFPPTSLDRIVRTPDRMARNAFTALVNCAMFDRHNAVSRRVESHGGSLPLGCPHSQQRAPRIAWSPRHQALWHVLVRERAFEHRNMGSASGPAMALAEPWRLIVPDRTRRLCIGRTG